MLKKDQSFKLLFFLITIFIIIRSLHFPIRLDFSTDQATSSIAVLEMVRNKHPVLIGPRFTLEYNGRYMFFGPAPYYFQAPFMILGDFDPIRSSYFFMLFSAFMVIPLYFGIKKLINQQSAILVTIFFTLLPFFINYSSFLWNPNFQFVLLPVLVWLMGNFKVNPNKKNFFLVFLAAGIILEFHYIFIIPILGIILYYFFSQKVKLSLLSLAFLGLLSGMAPLIVFDLRNDFYNFKTLILFIKHLNEVLPSAQKVSSQDPHYFLPFVFFGLILLCFKVYKFVSKKILILVFILLFSWSLISYLPTPSQGYGMASNWNYLDELKANQIIEANKPINFNIANLIYDPQAQVQKYLLKKDKIEFNDNYLSNDYLFILSTPKDYLNDPAFEIMKLQPAKEVQVWKINSYYNLYLAHREAKR